MFVLLAAYPVIGVAPGQQKDETMLEAKTYPGGRELGYPIIVRCKGQVLKNPYKIRFDLAKEKADLSTPEGTIESILAADRAGDVEWMASAYEPAKREKLRQTYSDEERLKKSIEASRKMLGVALLNKIKYGRYVGYMAEIRKDDGQTFVYLYPPCKLEQGNWLITSDLGADQGWRLLGELIWQRSLGVEFNVISGNEQSEKKRMIKRLIYPFDKVDMAPSVILYYMGRKYCPPVKVKLNGDIGKEPDKVETVLSKLYVACKDPNAEQIVDLLRPSERESLRPYIKKRATSIRAIVDKIKEIYLAEQVFYGDFVIALVEYKVESGLVCEDSFSLVREEEKWCLTDKLRQNRDPLLHYFAGERYVSPKIGPTIAKRPKRERNTSRAK
jgi:hypothetical protein